MDAESMNEMVAWAMKTYIKVVENEHKPLGQGRIFAEHIPIAEIDGLKITATNVRFEKSSISLIIYPHNSFLAEYMTNLGMHFERTLATTWNYETRTNDDIGFSQNTIREAMEKLVNILTELSYNTLQGTLTIDPHTAQKDKLFLRKLATLGKTKPQENECCVCYEATKTKFIKCKHHLCGKCLSHMTGEIKCPLCRYTPIERDGDDSDSD